MAQITITNDTDTIVFGDNAGLTTNSVIRKSNIVRVGGLFQANSVNGMGNSQLYGYGGGATNPRSTKTIVQIEVQHGQAISFDCDNVSNQATWHGGTQAALNTCIADINSWL